MADKRHMDRRALPVRMGWLLGLGLMAAIGCQSLHAEPPAEAPATAPAAAATDSAEPATTPAGEAVRPDALPHLTIDRENRRIDLDARVVLREGDWLELFACSPGSREHESILTIAARPSHIHFALLTLGLQPGMPMRWLYDEQADEFDVRPAHGPRIAVTCLYEKDGQVVEVPANEWVINQHTNEMLDSNVFIFTGSRLTEYEGKPVYLADLNGTVLSLVNFGDDLLVTPSKVTHQDDEQRWGTVTDRIPPLNSKVTVRLQVLPDEPQRPATPETPETPAANPEALGD